MSRTDTQHHEAYTVAHSAQCKLRIAVNRPDRNLRFILGHAFTFDNVMFQIAEIEGMGRVADKSLDHNHTETQPQAGGRRVSFHENAAKPTGELQSGLAPPASSKAGQRAKSPPPPAVQSSDSDEDDDEDEGDVDKEDQEENLGLTRFGSAAALPPRTISDEESDNDDDEPVSPEWEPSQDELKTVIASDGDEDMANLYESVRRCCCQDAPKVDKIWQLPQDKMGSGANGLTAVVKVKA